MKGSGSSLWPTARASEQKNRTAHSAPSHGKTHGELLAGMAGDFMVSWPTPMAGTPAQNGNSAAGNSDFSRRAEELAASLWATPDTPSGGRAMPPGTTLTGQTPDGRKVTVGLENQTRLWTTVQAHDVTMRGAGQVPTSKAGNACLARDAVTWGTPRASDAEKGGPNMAFGAGGTPLPAQAARWPTPAARDHKGENSPDHLTNGTGRLHMDQLPNAVAHGFSRPAPVTAPHGPTLSQLRRIWRPLRASLIVSYGRATWRRLWKGRARRRLNPGFVEWLMGWPTGHALCACSETEFTRWQQHMRGALSRLPMASGPWIWRPLVQAPGPAQMDLFEGLQP